MSQEIPLTDSGSQIFSTVLDGVTYQFNVAYNARQGAWIAIISIAGVVQVSGVALVAGVDIVKQLTMELNNLFVINLSNPNLDPTAEDLGTDSKLYKFSDDEVASIG